MDLGMMKMLMMMTGGGDDYSNSACLLTALEEASVSGFLFYSSYHSIRAFACHRDTLFQVQ